MDVLVGVAPAGPARLPGAVGDSAAPARRGAPRGRDAAQGDGGRRRGRPRPARGRLRPAPARRLPPRSTPTRPAACWEAADGGPRALRLRVLRQGQPRPRGPGPARRRLPRAAHALPDDRPPRRRRPAARGPGASWCAATTRSCPPTGRTSRRGPPRPCARYGRVRGRGRDRDPEAHPGRRGARRRVEQRGRRAAGPRPPVEAGARARTGSTRWPAAWGPTCPTSCSGAPPSASPGGTRSTPCAARSGPTSWSWTPGIHVSTARVFARVDAGLTPRLNSNSIFYFVSRELEGAGAFRLLVNDLEEAALEEAPALREQVGRIRAVLLEGGGASRGPLRERRELLRAVRGRAPGASGRAAALAERGFRALVARTLTLDQYRGAWGRARVR